ncbi:substrate-binding periplasmic protein [Psychromonas ossibalaenae]|uniref:substrate-binding periplasmic protein n=1 Tax=Psychromonas ossibalaenae TaxID=444922 RepID=UPI0003660F3E|nr:ABC transporter substrate-binding protein [Psychromonas ossibalaenae]
MLPKNILTSYLLMLTCFVFSAQLRAEQVSIGISFSIPPWVIKETETGLELDILKEALSVKGHTIKANYLPLARAFESFDSGLVDAVINVKKGMVKGFYSDLVVSFQNCAISLTGSKFVINDINDLQDKRIVAFQRASTILGQDFNAMTRKNTRYREVSDQSLQVKQLFKNRVDVVISERNIFKYFHNQSQQESLAGESVFVITAADLKQQVQYHCIFPPSHYHYAFTSEKIRDDFNYGLKTIRENGLYNKIFSDYAGTIETTPTPQP